MEITPISQERNRKPIGLYIIPILLIIYGIFDVGQTFFLIKIGDSIEYSLPIIGILFLVNGFGLLLLKKWARSGVIFSCIVTIVISIPPFINNPNHQNFILLINGTFIVLFGLVAFYFTRLKIRDFFK